MLRVIQATNGQGLDYHVEEDIYMRGPTQKTSIGCLASSTEALRNFSNREKVRSAIGLKTASPNRTWRRGVGREADLAAMGEVFCECNTLQIVPRRKDITSVGYIVQSIRGWKGIRFGKQAISF